uniref:Uncharacterized protein n=1 Tax=Xiphophorus maculatus TaxID=8083 RepID=A0A3B5Q9R4_XIPMA
KGKSRQEVGKREMKTDIGNIRLGTISTFLKRLCLCVCTITCKYHKYTIQAQVSRCEAVWEQNIKPRTKPTNLMQRLTGTSKELCELKGHDFTNKIKVRFQFNLYKSRLFLYVCSLSKIL